MSHQLSFDKVILLKCSYLLTIHHCITIYFNKRCQLQWKGSFLIKSSSIFPWLPDVQDEYCHLLTFTDKVSHFQMFLGTNFSLNCLNESIIFNFYKREVSALETTSVCTFFWRTSRSYFRYRSNPSWNQRCVTSQSV